MADGAWRAFSLYDGEKERTNENTGKIVFDGNCNGSDGHEHEGTSPTTGRRQATGYIARYDWCDDSSAWTGADATSGRFAARIATRNIRGSSRHARAGASGGRTEHGRVQEQFQIQGAYDGAARGGERIFFSGGRRDLRPPESRGTSPHHPASAKPAWG